LIVAELESFVQFLRFRNPNPPLPRLAHCDNHDGSVDSICTIFFVTVATSQWEADLDKAEQDHVCNPAMQARFECMRVH
jgi:hypothetical protein